MLTKNKLYQTAMTWSASTMLQKVQIYVTLSTNVLIIIGNYDKKISKTGSKQTVTSI